MTYSNEDNRVPEHDPDVQHLFDAARKDLGSPEQVSGIARRLSATLGVGLLGHAELASATWLGSATGKFTLGGIVALGLFGTGVALQPSTASVQVTAPTAAVREHAVLSPTTSPLTSPPLKTVESSASTQQAEPQSRPRAPTVKSAPPGSASEARLLLKARQALERSPADALALVARHRNAFPASSLTEERELIRIAALRKLGRAAEVQKEVERFNAAYPNSVHGQQGEGGSSPR